MTARAFRKEARVALGQEPLENWYIEKWHNALGLYARDRAEKWHPENPVVIFQVRDAIYATVMLEELNRPVTDAVVIPYPDPEQT